MPRRGFIPKREVLADPIYNSVVVTKLINQLMMDGKRGVAQKAVYDAFDSIREKTGREPGEVFEQAVPIASMNIQYFDPSKKEWQDQWNSLEERRIPGGIWIRINFARTEEDRQADYAAGIDLNEHPDFEFMLSFPMGRNVEYPFPDFNHLRYFSDEVL